ncbi:MAG: phosphate butyryltransferase [Candidatus Marinimicrobia bacterium]|nr:phosphate butyryltransferase [Candidatus Neomarinimicrobiota bacterium]
MITSYEQIFAALEKTDPIPIAIVQPKSDFLLNAINDATKNGWITPLIFEHSVDLIAAQQAVASVKNGEAKLMMKGDIETATVLKAVLDDKELRTDQRLSHVAVVESPNYDRLMLWSDGGVNIDLNHEIMDSIITNAYVMAKALNIHHPNIALLTLVETVNEKLPETILAFEMEQKYSSYNNFSIEGPIALDVALSREAAVSKGLSSSIAGKTDVFIGPSITVTNHVVKSLMSIGGAKGGGIILGAQVPIVLLSRSDSSETKLNSIALGVLTSTGD